MRPNHLWGLKKKNMRESIPLQNAVPRIRECVREIGRENKGEEVNGNGLTLHLDIAV